MTLGAPRQACRGRGADGGARPVVVVPFGSWSVPLLQVAEAARPVCDVVWLVHSGDPVVATARRLLGRLGHVVDAAGLDADQLAAAVAVHRPSGAVALVDRDLVPLAGIADRLGLPFHSPVVARRLSDKVAQRRALRQAGLPVPACWELSARPGPAEVADVARQASYPAVVKPRVGTSSRHTVRVDDADELAAVVDAFAGHPGGAEAMVVEEYLPGLPSMSGGPFADYVSVETLADASGLHHLAVSGRLPVAEPFRETALFIPSTLGRADTEAVLSTASAALDALGVRQGCCHTEVKLTPTGPRVIEVNGRIGGGVPDVLRMASGMDLLRLCFRAALGDQVGPHGPVACERVAYRLVVQPPASARTVRSVDGLQAVGRVPGVEDVSLNRRPGDSVEPWRGTLTFVLSVLGTAADHAGVLRAYQQVQEAADIVYDHDGAAATVGAAPGEVA